jgi:hypothetical protein
VRPIPNVLPPDVQGAEQHAAFREPDAQHSYQAGLLHEMQYERKLWQLDLAERQDVHAVRRTATVHAKHAHQAISSLRAGVRAKVLLSGAATRNPCNHRCNCIAAHEPARSEEGGGGLRAYQGRRSGGPGSGLCPGRGRQTAEAAMKQVLWHMAAVRKSEE